VTSGLGVARSWPHGRIRPKPRRGLSAAPSPRYWRDLVKLIRASLRSGDALTQAIQGKVRCAASQLTDKSAVLKEAAASGRVSLL
jgi:hypothetical protein